MIDPGILVKTMRERGFGPFIGVPCSHLGGVISTVEASGDDEYVIANNEGEAVAIAAGLRLAGAQPVVLMQNSGLGNAVNPLTSLVRTLDIPLLVLVTWRGEPGCEDEPQHRLMGAVTRDLLDLIEVPHAMLTGDGEDLGTLLDEARVHLARRSPYALIVPMKTILSGARGPTGPANPLPTRAEVIDMIVAAASPDTAVVATTGKTARELEAIADRPGNLYVVGSMGCASSVALGVALRAPYRPVVVIDGDGAALMRMEAMATIGRLRPPNLTHLLLDNGAYESTGGQPTGSSGVDLPLLAQACGYPRVHGASTAEDIDHAVRAAMGADELAFAHLAIRIGSDPGLGRPSLAPPAAAARFEAFLWPVSPTVPADPPGRS